MVTWYAKVPGGYEIEIIAVPRSSRSRVTGVYGERLKVQLAAPPSEGAANDALVALLVERLGVNKRAVELVAGHGSRQKRVRVLGVDEAQLLALLE